MGTATDITCYAVAVGPVYFGDEPSRKLSHYTIDIEARKSESDSEGKMRKSWEVLFQRDFEINELPIGFEKEAISNVVVFDEQKRIVHFNIGTRNYEYQLPQP